MPESVIIPIAVLLLIVLLYHYLPGGAARRGLRQPTDRDDERYWLGGIIYNNPDDPDLFVPKRFGLGRTVNIARPLGKVILFGPLLLPLLLAILRGLAQR